MKKVKSMLNKLGRKVVIALSVAILVGMGLKLRDLYEQHIPVLSVESCLIYRVDRAFDPNSTEIGLGIGKIMENDVKNGEATIATQVGAFMIPLKMRFSDLRSQGFIKAECL